MGRLIKFIFIFAFLVAFSCHKKEETLVSKELPEWLQLKIAELVPDQKLCEITDVTFIEYKGQIYYHVYCGIWSCMYCQLFDQQGNRPNWDSDVWQDFLAKKREIQTVPACTN